MAIQFARIEFVNRAKGGRACIKGAYNSRDKIQELCSGRIFHFKDRSKNLYHKVFLPEHVDRKFLDVSELMNEVERCEKKKNSKLLKEVVIALPKEEEVGDRGREKILEDFINKMEWVKEGLGVQADIHPPHGEREVNYHAHILITTRRFRSDGLGLGAKARDLEPKFRNGGGQNFIVKEDKMISEKFREVQEEYFRQEGLDLKVDAISRYPEIRIGPKRFRSENAAKLVKINEERKLRNVREMMKDPSLVSEKISERQLFFTKSDVRRFLSRYEIESEGLVEKVVGSSKVTELIHVNEYGNDEKFLGQYVRKDSWNQVERILRNAEKISRECKNVELSNSLTRSYIGERVRAIAGHRKYDEESKVALYKLAITNSGVKVLRGAAGTGKSRVLVDLADYVYCDYKVICIAPTNKAVNELREKGLSNVETVSRFYGNWRMVRARLGKVV